MKRARSTFMIIATVSLAGCGDDGFFDNPDAGGDDYCTAAVGLPPGNPEAPATINVSGSFSGTAPGPSTFGWSVRKEGDPSFSIADPGDVSSFSFTAPTPGLYVVTLFGERSGTTCSSDSGSVNVVEPGASSELYRFRLVPPASAGAPTQEHVREVFGGATSTYDVGNVDLDTGFAVTGAVTDSLGDPVQAYLRFTTIGDVDPMATEVFSTSAGEFDVFLGSGMYDVLIVPQGNARAPVELTGIPVTSLDELVVPAGTALSGTVLDGQGQPVMGAVVSLAVGGVPTTIGTTDAAGAFMVLGHPGDTTTIHVAPPDGSGLPELSLGADANLVAVGGEALVIRYADTLTARSLSVPVTLTDGTTPAPGARVTFIARTIAAAGTVTPGGAGALAMSGAGRVAVTADGGGELVGVALAEAFYDVIVEPPADADPDEGVTVTALDLQLGVPAPAALSLGPWATLDGAVVDEQLAGIDQVRVTAIPTGLLAGTTTAAAMAMTAAGAYSLSVAGGGAYELVFDATNYSRARARASIVAGAAGQSTVVDPIEMPAALKVNGTIRLGANGLAGVSITLLCYECTGVEEASLSIAEAVSAPGGDFSLAVPNPGVNE